MNRVIIFDFDGTITYHDTFISFISFAKGYFHCYLGFLICSPIIFLWKIGLIKNWQAKQFIFSYFFKGMNLDEFNELGKDFSESISKDSRPKAIEEIKKNISQKNEIIIISASIENWITPWASSVGINNILSTKIDVTPANKLTGKFSSKNCHGKEKVNRLLEAFPLIASERQNYYIIAFGDSKGDKDIINYSDEGYLNYFQ